MPLLHVIAAIVALVVSSQIGIFGVQRYHPGRSRHRGNVYNESYSCCGARTTSYDQGMSLHSPAGCKMRIVLLGCTLWFVYNF